MQRTATQLFQEHLAFLANEPEKWRELYDEREAVMEFPYAYAIGAPTRYEGRDAIFNHVQGVFAQLRDPVFSNVSVQKLESSGEGKDEEERIVAEFELAAIVKSSGRAYNQKYIALMMARRGKIVFLREYWNPHEVLKSFEALPGL